MAGCEAAASIANMPAMLVCTIMIDRAMENREGVNVSARGKWKAGLAVCCCLFLFSSCGGAARQILVLPDSGVIAVSSNTEASRTKALELMARHCPAGFDVTREEEVPVGERVREETRTDIDRRDRITSTTDYRVRTRYEWRMEYTCR